MREDADPRVQRLGHQTVPHEVHPLEDAPFRPLTAMHKVTPRVQHPFLLEGDVVGGDAVVEAAVVVHALHVCCKLPQESSLESQAAAPPAQRHLHHFYNSIPSS